MKENVLGYFVNTESKDICINNIISSISNENRCNWLACLNPHSYAVSLSDQKFATALKDAEWLVPDGIGAVLASRILGGSIFARITGSDIFYALHERMNSLGGMSVFFLGATEDALNEIQNKMKIDFPNIRVAGTYSPPFKAEYSSSEIEEMINTINMSCADVLWVGMTAPKQEKWIFENRSRLNVKFAGAIGAVFDFYTGRVKRSHPIFQRAGLEWLPRLLQQPRRLWKRTFVSAPIYIWHVAKQKFGMM